MVPESNEITVGRLDERVKALSSTVGGISEDIKRIAASYEKLVESTQRIALLEADMVLAKAGQNKLWEKYDAMDSARITTEKVRLEEALKSNNRWIGEVIRMLLASGFTGAVAAALYHFGIH